MSRWGSATVFCKHKTSSPVTQMRIWEQKEVLDREKFSFCFLTWQEAALFCFQQVASKDTSQLLWNQLPEQCHQQILLPPSPVLKLRSALYKHLSLQLPLFANSGFFCSSPPLHHSLHSILPLPLQAEAPPGGEIFLIRHLGKVKAILG